ncbi:hypothetical protein NHX12_013899 [Muraenolepis orangiensis]|uniref:Uncharacterized protein n=1 Tax=Muraenolepis orangiensis TaxID=630683 RepID=A0A9Q0I538_9TELE|nr:hypothetical protein NHX12_013899 [Muraenolepis orangiensis]
MLVTLPLHRDGALAHPAAHPHRGAPPSSSAVGAADPRRDPPSVGADALEGVRGRRVHHGGAGEGRLKVCSGGGEGGEGRGEEREEERREGGEERRGTRRGREEGRWGERTWHTYCVVWVDDIHGNCWDFLVDLTATETSPRRPPSSPTLHIRQCPAKGFSDPAKGFSDPAKGFSDPVKGFSDPAKGFSDPAKGFSDPAKGLQVKDSVVQVAGGGRV